MKESRSEDSALYYVMGASGAGKDSLMRFVRQRCADTPLMFAHRYITRPAEAGGEDHVAVSIEAFNRLRDAGAFALHWSANGLHYGVGIEIEHWLAAGLKVVLNGSREHLPQASARFPRLRPIMIEVSPERLGERLRARGRESDAEVLARIDRGYRLPPPVHPRLCVVRNDDELELAGEALLDVITGHRTT
ncbi:MAG TPA: phosphonate metabolism protein/1,5-bisphosphokinase (PRPP-forming) PhnN [Azoarcus taiwanensis]|nr:phosphonate metabolism protein/1,5-bisphosphokinase (PRPP-forming) PhnN [Azoarcus taiwanensis]